MVTLACTALLMCPAPPAHLVPREHLTHLALTRRHGTPGTPLACLLASTPDMFGVTEVSAVHVVPSTAWLA